MAALDNKCALTGLIGFRSSPDNWERAEWLKGQFTVTVRVVAVVDSERPDSHGEGPWGGKSLCSSLFKTHTFS